MAKMSPLNIKKILCLSNIFLFSSVFGFATAVNADVEGIPFNSSFPTAQYPYAQAPDGCSGWTSTKQVRDNWGPVSFTGACNTHDKCYYTRGSNWNTCNERFYSDLRAACERDLRISTPLGKLPPDPVRLTACYQIATAYYGVVQGAVALGVFKEAQDKQRSYEEWVATIRNPSFSWSQAGAISGMACTRIYEEADPHAWSDNFLCAPSDIGMRWSQAGAIGGMKCTRIHEDADPHAWSDNFLCVPQSSPINFRWSQAGAIGGKKCLRVHEDADPHAWSDNYLCW
jgi:hypothetical protein